jgi:cutinase
MKIASSLLALMGITQVLATPIIQHQLATNDTENDLTDGSPCKAVTVIFARGSTESGNVGTLAGPPFFASLATDIGASNLAVQGVGMYFSDVCS